MARPSSKWGPAKPEDRAGTKYERQEEDGVPLEVIGTATLPPYVYTGNGIGNGHIETSLTPRDSNMEVKVDLSNGGIPPPSYDNVAFSGECYRF